MYTDCLSLSDICDALEYGEKLQADEYLKWLQTYKNRKSPQPDRSKLLVPNSFVHLLNNSGSWTASTFVAEIQPAEMAELHRTVIGTPVQKLCPRLVLSGLRDGGLPKV